MANTRDAEGDSGAQSAQLNSENGDSVVNNKQLNSKNKPKRVVGADGKSYLAKKNKPKPMKSFGELG